MGLRWLMPWTQDDFPDSMKSLDPDAREKAIEIANTLVEEEGYEEGRAIAIAQSQAEDIVDPDSSPSGGGGQQGKGRQEKGAPQHVLPHEAGWAVKREGAGQPSKTFETKEQARQHAVEVASNQNADIIFHDAEGTTQKRWEDL